MALLETRFLAYLELSRPINGVIAFISVLLGAMFTRQEGLNLLTDSGLLTVATSALLLLSAGNAINDYCDYQIDQINKPQRPIPSARVQRSGALIFAIVLIGAGVTLGAVVNRYAAVIAVSVSICLIAYALWLKRTPIVGNLVVGVLTGLTFIAGGVAVQSTHGTLVPATFAFLFTTAREIVKDIEDTEGDFENSARTIAVISKSLAVLMALIFMATVIVFSPVPYLLGWYSWRYLLMVFIGVDLVLIYLAVRLWKDASKENSARIQQWMKWDIFIGLGVIYVGSFA